MQTRHETFYCTEYYYRFTVHVVNGTATEICNNFFSRDAIPARYMCYGT